MPAEAVTGKLLASRMNFNPMPPGREIFEAVAKLK